MLQKIAIIVLIVFFGEKNSNQAKVVFLVVF